MSKNNWRNMQWSNMGFSERTWFIIMCLLLVVLFVFIYLDGTNTVDIPDWVGLLWMAAALFAAYKNVAGNNLFNEDEFDEDSDPEDDTE